MDGQQHQESSCSQQQADGSSPPKKSKSLIGMAYAADIIMEFIVERNLLAQENIFDTLKAFLRSKKKEFNEKVWKEIVLLCVVLNQVAKGENAWPTSPQEWNTYLSTTTEDMFIESFTTKMKITLKSLLDDFHYQQNNIQDISLSSQSTPTTSTSSMIAVTPTHPVGRRGSSLQQYMASNSARIDALLQSVNSQKMTGDMSSYISVRRGAKLCSLKWDQPLSDYLIQVFDTYLYQS